MSFLNVTCLTPLLLCPIEMFETFISFPIGESPRLIHVSAACDLDLTLSHIGSEFSPFN